MKNEEGRNPALPGLWVAVSRHSAFYILPSSFTPLALCWSFVDALGWL
jgi:hypothetical protein